MYQALLEPSQVKMNFDSIFTVDSMNLKTADILSGYYNILNKRREELEAKNQPEINPEPQDLDDGKYFKPTYIRHKIFDPVKKKNIWVPNKRLYDPRWLERKTSQVAVQENQNSSMYPEDVLYGSWEGQTRCIKVTSIEGASLIDTLTSHVHRHHLFIKGLV